MSELGYIEEKMVRQGEMNMRLLINHAQRHLRFMDFRVGNYDQKRELLDETALEYGLRKAFTLVEKQDTGSWRSVGFVREGVYPSFFRTADAYIMSRIYDDEQEPYSSAPTVPKSTVEQEDLNDLGKRDKIRLKLSDRFPEIRTFMERLKTPLLTVPFGRVGDPDMLARAWLRTKESWICIEIDESFGHAMLTFSPHPDNLAALRLCYTGVEQLHEPLIDRGVNNLFSLSSDTDVWAGQLFNGLGFKVTGRLARHITVDGAAGNALVWHKRVGNHKK